MTLEKEAFQLLHVKFTIHRKTVIAKIWYPKYAQKFRGYAFWKIMTQNGFLKWTLIVVIYLKNEVKVKKLKKIMLQKKI